MEAAGLSPVTLSVEAADPQGAATLARGLDACDPALVLLGGTLAESGGALLAGVRDGLRRATSRAGGSTPTVALGTLGPRAEALGAVAIARRSLDLAVGGPGRGPRARAERVGG